jgi:hypothetical protein
MSPGQRSTSSLRSTLCMLRLLRKGPSPSAASAMMSRLPISINLPRNRSSSRLRRNSSPVRELRTTSTPSPSVAASVSSPNSLLWESMTCRMAQSLTAVGVRSMAAPPTAVTGFASGCTARDGIRLGPYRHGHPLRDSQRREAGNQAAQCARCRAEDCVPSRAHDRYSACPGADWSDGEESFAAARWPAARPTGSRPARCV